MTQSICAIPGPISGKTELRVTLVCEGDHGLFGVPCQTVTGPDYIALRASLTQDGWKRSGNKWLCPGCAK